MTAANNGRRKRTYRFSLWAERILKRYGLPCICQRCQKKLEEGQLVTRVRGNNRSHYYHADCLERMRI
jgi:hypothetical protein